MNYFGTFGGGSAVISTILISNNIIGNGPAYISGVNTAYFSFTGTDNGVIEYNNFGMLNTQFALYLSATFSLRYNIIRGTGNAINANASFTYNIAEQANFLPSGNGNVNGVNMSGTAMFVDSNRTTANDGDSFYQLSATSPANTASENGTPIGAYASLTPYNRSGIPAIPTIYSLTLPSSTVTGNSVQVKFSSRSNQ